MIKVLALVGESGAGKSLMASLLAEDERFNYIQSYTTREPRKVNEEGHIFTDKIVYDKHCNLNGLDGFKIIVETYYDGAYYWTVSTQFKENKINVYTIDPKGIEGLKKNKEFDILIVYLKADQEIRINRMTKREMENHTSKNVGWDYEISRSLAWGRIANDKEAFRIVQADYIVDANNQSSEVLEDIKKIVERWKNEEIKCL